MSPERRQGKKDVDPIAVWGPTLIARNEGRALTPDQQRAIDIRTACLGIVSSIDQLIEDPTIQQDPVREASAIGAYWEGMLKIQDLGITEKMHVGDNPGNFGSPRKLAEYVAGQLIGIDGERLPNVRQALSAVQEHSEEEIQLPGTSPDQDRSLFVMPTKNMQPKLKEWIVLRAMVGLTHNFLASDLDSPEGHSVEATPNNEQITTAVDTIVDALKTKQRVTIEEETSRPLNEQQEAAKSVLERAGVMEATAGILDQFPNFSPKIRNVAWDEKGECEVKGIKGEPNSAGIVISWSEERYPKIREDELLGTMVVFRGVVIEAHEDGTIDVKGKGRSKNRNWVDKDTQKAAIQHALETPAYFEYFEEADALKDGMVPYEPIAGMYITEATERMVRLADRTGKTVVASFNDIGLIVMPGDDPLEINKYYNEQSHNRHQEYLNSPEGEYNRRESEKANRRAAREARKPLANFSIKDAEAWQKSVEANNDGGYGRAVISYAARWASMMEKQLAAGARLEDIADRAGHKADVEGITGFQYGCAVSLLSATWEHGDELRRWHNLKYQLGDEGEKANESGGVLNPALLGLCSKES